MSQASPFISIDPGLNIANKRHVISAMQALVSASHDKLAEVAHAAYHPHADLHIIHPFNDPDGIDQALEQFWQPLRRAFPDAERREDIVAGGYYHGGEWVGCLGHLLATFQQDFVGIPATRRPIALRFAEGHRLHDGKIQTSYLFIDLLDLMRQAGIWPIAPSLGHEMTWLAPRTHDGVVLTPQDEARSQRNLERVLAMHAALGRYPGDAVPSRRALDAMAMIDHWHAHFMWYGPAGIGTTRGLRGFEDHHQIPFLTAFPDRGGTDNPPHFISIGDGDYVVTGGWGSLQATHTGGNWLGMPPTGRRIHMRVMDFYRCDEQTIVENWVPIDVLHILWQMGFDVLERVQQTR
ncbi:MAG: ester cyclase [Anaerolineae bacterium]|nr:ester cyclase [Anaerolineae bacterium]MDW8173723.1 ester cyclase [Anaerolineae bacterium]